MMVPKTVIMMIAITTILVLKICFGPPVWLDFVDIFHLLLDKFVTLLWPQTHACLLVMQASIAVGNLCQRG